MKSRCLVASIFLLDINIVIKVVITNINKTIIINTIKNSCFSCTNQICVRYAHNIMFRS